MVHGQARIKPREGHYCELLTVNSERLWLAAPTDPLVDPIEVLHRIELHFDRPSRPPPADPDLRSERLPEGVSGRPDRRFAGLSATLGAARPLHSPHEGFGCPHGEAQADRLFAGL